jgi:hypothetical protein
VDPLKRPVKLAQMYVMEYPDQASERDEIYEGRLQEP